MGSNALSNEHKVHISIFTPVCEGTQSALTSHLQDSLHTHTPSLVTIESNSNPGHTQIEFCVHHTQTPTDQALPAFSALQEGNSDLNSCG